MKIALLVLACVAASQAKFQYAFATPYYYYGANPWAPAAAYPVIDTKSAEKVDTKTPASTVNAPTFYSAWPYGYSAVYPYGFGYQYFTNQFPAAPAAAAADTPAAAPAEASSDSKDAQVVEASPAQEESASRKKRDLAYYATPYAYPYAYGYYPYAPAVKSVVAPVAPVAAIREATLTKTVLNPGHAVAYRVD